jgi:hypothetical protein
MMVREEYMVAIIDRIAKLLIAASIVAVTMAGNAIAQCPTTSTAVITYHYDNFRTGWNCNETQLTPANVATPSGSAANPVKFGLLYSVALDDQVDAQRLFVPQQTITFPSGTITSPTGNRTIIGFSGIFDVVYVATENNTIYAINAANGEVLLQQNFGIPRQTGQCNSGPNIGINSTPVIDRVHNVMCVMVLSTESVDLVFKPHLVFKLHKLSLSTLTDAPGSPVPVTASASQFLVGVKGMMFNAETARQRPGLVLVDGKVSAGFGSFCDWPDSRGWLLGWDAGSLTALPANQLNNFQITATSGSYPSDSVPDRFLASIWMSGYGVAADESNSLYFVTGNSNSKYDPVTSSDVYPGESIQQSVVKIYSDLTEIQLFTPLNSAALDVKDADFGSGGVILLPDQPGPTPYLAVAAGKYDRCPPRKTSAGACRTLTEQTAFATKNPRLRAVTHQCGPLQNSYVDGPRLRRG